jgi:hypothetical protein
MGKSLEHAKEWVASIHRVAERAYILGNLRAGRRTGV